MPEELAEQMPLIKEVLTDMNIDISLMWQHQTRLTKKNENYLKKLEKNINNFFDF
jgi:hypothetical protein